MPKPITIFSDMLTNAGLRAAEIVVHRIALHPADCDEDYRTTADLVRTGHALIYERIQDGPMFGAEAVIASFLPSTEDTVRFAGLRTLTARGPGIAPGDIVYDPEIAHLLHNFIARAKNPTFYDAVPHEREAMLQGAVLRWRDATDDVRRGDDPSLVVLEDQA